MHRLLEEKPQVSGIATPDMPTGSPGMEHGEHKEPYEVVSFDRQGDTRICEAALTQLRDRLHSRAGSRRDACRPRHLWRAEANFRVRGGTTRWTPNCSPRIDYSIREGQEERRRMVGNGSGRREVLEGLLVDQACLRKYPQANSWNVLVSTHGIAR